MNLRQNKFWSLFSSIKMAIWLLTCIAALSIIGTLIPQNKAPMEYITRYGHTTYNMFSKAGLTNVYAAWWFVALLLLLAVNLLVCIVNSFTLRIRTLGTKIAHISVLVIFAGALIGVFFGEKGYVEVYEGKSIDSFVYKNHFVKLDFAVRLDDFIYEEYISPDEKVVISSKEGKPLVSVSAKAGSVSKVPGTDYSVKVLRYVPDFVMDMASKKVISRSADPRNPAVQVELTGKEGTKTFWVFAAYPDIHNKIGEDLKIKYVWAQRKPKDFISKLTVIKDGEEVLQKDIRVNFPLKFEDYTFFQSSYDKNELAWSGLQVVKDPGVPVVYLGFALMIIGLIMKFYIGPLSRKGK